MLSSLQTTLKKEHKSLPVYNVIVHNLQQHLHHLPPSTHTMPIAVSPKSLHSTVQAAIDEQTSIRWYYFLKVHVSNLWSTAQQSCYAQRTDLDKREYTIIQWRKRLLESIVNGCIKY